MAAQSLTKETIENAWESRGQLDGSTGGDIRQAVEHALALLDAGEARVAEKGGPIGSFSNG